MSGNRFLFSLSVLAIFGFWIAGVIAGGDLGHKLAVAAWISVAAAIVTEVVDD